MSQSVGSRTNETPREETKHAGPCAGRYIDRPLLDSNMTGCFGCGWEGVVGDCTCIRLESMDPDHVARLGTGQQTQTDVYCPRCGTFIISFFELE